MIQHEIWKPIKEFPDYWISDYGRVKSYKYRNQHMKNKKWKVLKVKIDRLGYHNIRLQLNGKSFHRSIHRLMATAFIPNFDKLKYVDHIDQDKNNNSLSNLRWVNHSINTHNRRLLKNNTSGYKYISWCKRDKKWWSRVSINNKIYNIGSFSTKEEAYKAQIKYLQEHFPTFVQYYLVENFKS